MIVVVLFWNARNKFLAYLLQILFLSAFLFVVLILAQRIDKCNTQNTHSFRKTFVHILQIARFLGKQICRRTKTS